MRIIAFLALLACTSAFQRSFSNRITSTRLQMAVEITTAMVKTLRDKSGAGMLDCKKALAENNGDIEGAVDWLRKKGLAAVAKKAGRTASNGLVGVATTSDGKSGAVVEINAETDFAARNDMFTSMVGQVSEIAAKENFDHDSLLKAPFVGESKTVGEEITRLVATIGENMNFRRVARLSVNNGQVCTYMHTATKPGMGKIGCMVALESTATDLPKLQELGKQIAMHIAANSPEALNVAQVKPESLAREKQVLVEQAKASGKPDAAIEKMVEGRIRKFYEEVVLLEQPFVMDSKLKVSALVDKVAKEVGAPIEVTGYVRFQLGEGIEKKEE